MQLCKIIPHEHIPNNQVNEYPVYQDPYTIDEPDFFSTHIPTNTQCQDQQSEEELGHEMENPRKIVIQLQPEADGPPSLPEFEITIPLSHPSPLTTYLTLQEDVPVVTHHDYLPSPEDDPPQLEFETHPVSPKLVTVPPQPSSTPVHDNRDHEAPERNHARTHTTRYNLGENPKPRIYQDYFKLELGNKPALAKILLGKNH